MNTHKIVMNAKRGLVLTRNLIIKQSPIILTVAAVGGVITTVGLCVKATTEAEKLIEKKKIENNMQVDEKLSITETIATVWKPYVPVVMSAGLTIGAIVGSSAINEKRKAALAGLYAISETALQEYQQKTEQFGGEKLAQKIKDEVNRDRARGVQIPLTDEDLPSGKCPVIDIMSGRIFYSTIQDIRDAVQDINDGILNGDMCCSLNEFYDSIPGLGANGLGSDCGWNLTHLARPHFTSTLSSQGKPMLVLDWTQDGGPISTYRDI